MPHRGFQAFGSAVFRAVSLACCLCYAKAQPGNPGPENPGDFLLYVIVILLMISGVAVWEAARALAPATGCLCNRRRARAREPESEDEGANYSSAAAQMTWLTFLYHRRQSYLNKREMREGRENRNSALNENSRPSTKRDSGARVSTSRARPQTGPCSPKAST